MIEVWITPDPRSTTQFMPSWERCGLSFTCHLRAAMKAAREYQKNDHAPYRLRHEQTGRIVMLA